MWATAVPAPIATSAYAPGHCHATPGQPFLNLSKGTCSDAHGRNGEELPYPQAACRRHHPHTWDIPETKDAARICTCWTDPWGFVHPPLIPGGARPAGRQVCDHYWGITTASYPDVKDMWVYDGNMMMTRYRLQNGFPFEAYRC